MAAVSVPIYIAGVVYVGFHLLIAVESFVVAILTYYLFLVVQIHVPVNLSYFGTVMEPVRLVLAYNILVDLQCCLAMQPSKLVL